MENLTTYSSTDWRRYSKFSVDFNVAQNILHESMIQMLNSSEKASLRKYLPLFLYVYLKDRRTAFGGTLLDVVRVGLSNFEATIPAIATDQFCYESFHELFEPIVRRFHPPLKQFQPWSNWGSWTTLSNLDMEKKYISSSCIRCSRNMDGYRFTPNMNPYELDTVELAVVKALEQLPAEFKGRYVQVGIIESNVSRALDLKPDMFVEDPRVQTPNVTSHWPRGRGIFGTPDGKFAVLVNEKDHLCVCSFEAGGQLHMAYRRLAVVMPQLDRKLRSVRNPRFGYLTVSPALLGNTLRIFVNITLRNTPTHDLLTLAERNGLTVLKNTKDPGPNYFIFNITEIGLNEIKQMEKFSTSIKDIIKFDKYHAANLNTRSSKAQNKPRSPTKNFVLKNKMQRGLQKAKGLKRSGSSEQSRGRTLTTHNRNIMTR